MWSENQTGSQPKLQLIAVSEQNVTGSSKAAFSGLLRVIQFKKKGKNFSRCVG